MNPQLAATALEFLARVDLKGAEAAVFMAVAQELNRVASTQPQPLPEPMPAPKPTFVETVAADPELTKEVKPRLDIAPAPPVRRRPVRVQE